MKVEKEKFDRVLGKMISQPPQKTSEIRAGKKGKGKKPKPSSR